MPCYDPGYPDEDLARYREEILEEKERRELTEAMLCAVLGVLETRIKHGLDVFNLINYKEAGFGRSQLELWWRKHKELDAARRSRERKARERKAAEAAKKAEADKLRREAFKKLTPAERKALGLKPLK